MKKGDFVYRLTANLQSNPSTASNVPPTCPTVIAPSDVQCQWKVLNAETTPVDFTPNNSFADPFRNKQNEKVNYSDRFERPKFKHAYLSHERTGRNNALKKDSNGNPLLVTKVIKRAFLI